VAYTEAELNAKILALETTLARGELRVDFADRSVTYRSIDEIVKSLEYFQRLLVPLAAATSRPVRQFFGVASRGLS